MSKIKCKASPELTSEVYRYWGKLAGSLYGTLTAVYELEDGGVLVYNNQIPQDNEPQWSYEIDKKIADKLRERIK